MFAESWRGWRVFLLFRNAVHSYRKQLCDYLAMAPVGHGEVSECHNTMMKAEGAFAVRRIDKFAGTCASRALKTRISPPIEGFSREESKI